MPDEYNAVEDGELNDLLRKRLGMNAGAPVPTLEPAFFPALVLESDRFEYGWLKQEHAYSYRGAVSAGVGRSSIELFNGSRNALVVVRECSGSMAANSLFGKILVYAQGVAGTPAGGAVGKALDGRNAIKGSAVRSSGCTITEDNVNAVKSGQVQWQLANGVLTPEWVLPPFTSLYLYASVDAAAISLVNLRWTERIPNPLELG